MGAFGLPLLLDKSALQSVSTSSIDVLTRHYLMVLPPILLLEVVGDLLTKKGKIQTENSELNTNLVRILAQKVKTHSAVKNVDYRTIAEGELNGFNADTNFRPCVACTKTKMMVDGSTAVLIDNEIEMGPINNWQDEIFSEEDKRYAKDFRKRSREKDLNEYKDQVKKLGPLPFTGNSIQEIYRQVDVTVRNAIDQWTFLSWYCRRLQISDFDRNEIFKRFRRSTGKFNEFAPYTYYCFLVESVFIWALANDLISSSKSAKSHIDIEYAYYFPFVRVFSSNDKFHAELWKVFGDSAQQTFISGTELGKDLSELKSHSESLPEKDYFQLCNIAPYPPIIKHSPTYQVFEKMQKIGVLMMREDFEGNTAGQRTKEEERELVEKILQKYNYLKD